MSFPVLISFFAALIQAHAGEQPAVIPVLEAINLCTNETNASQQQIKILFKRLELPKDDVEKCYLECIYKKTGMIVDGKLNVEGITKLINIRYNGVNQTLAKQTLESCRETVAAKEGEKCSLGMEFRKCSMDHGSMIGFVPEF